ncbi:MAG: sigma-70 family RNA polymerase sigma factor [Candidatus Dormibacterales bacterium]
MAERDWLAGRFEEHRPHLRAVAYRLLGSLAEADDAIQEAWLRASRSSSDEVENLGGWLTTIVARVALNMLRARNARREETYGVRLPDPVVSLDGELQPEEEALLADSVGLALLVVLDSLAPAERLAFVLHDVFQLPFEEIATMVARTPTAARQLASRARRRVQGANVPAPDPDRSRQRDVVNAFFAAARGGDLAALLAVLDPEVVLRADFGPKHPSRSVVIRGAATVADQAFMGGALVGATVHPALVNGAAGAVITVGRRPFAVMGFIVAHGRIVEICAIADPQRVGRIAAPIFGAPGQQG